MGRRRKGSGAHLSGVVVVDKPRGPTSHDIVSRIRKKLDTGRVGHAGTLDPMATGVLVVAVGEGTKLVPYLTAADKRYEATIAVGVATDSLDADGEPVGEGPSLQVGIDAVRAAAASFVGPHRQRAPRVSAIKVDGERLHARARRGEEFEAPERDVVLHEVRVHHVEPGSVQLELSAGKGFYVRSFARDLMTALGTVGHLSALRRTASGAFGLDAAVGLDSLGPESLIEPADAASRVMPRVEVGAAATSDLRMGRRVDAEGDLPGPVALVHEGALVAIAAREGDRWQVVRGFAPPAGA